MSGSPVFINGRMIGAYAYGWQFGSEPIAGVTPIRSMLDELARPLPMMRPLPSASIPGPSTAADADQGTAFVGSIGTYDLREHAKQLALLGAPAVDALGAKLSQLATPILLGGIGDRTSRGARELLEPLGLDPVQAGGAGNGAASHAPSR